MGVCGDGICDPGIGEDCLSCGEDCAGQQTGPANQRFCCGDGDGVGPVDCSDSRCTTGGFSCGPTTSQTCCGDGVCEAGAEDSCNCAADCGPGAPLELICDDGLDDDCDGLIDCSDSDCCADGACATGVDGDGDGVADCDCDDTDDQIWDTPGEAVDLRLDPDGTGGTKLEWSEPVLTGAVSLTYDVLRSDVASDFVGMTECLPSADRSSRVWTENASPVPGGIFHYVVRAVNDCPRGVGSLGSNSANEIRAGRACP
jgi:hypothetical protein